MNNHIFFFQTSWKDGLSEKIVLEFDLSCIIGKDDISFSRKYDLTPSRKIKNEKKKKIKKNTRKYDIFFKSSEKIVFSKRIAPGHDLSCTTWKGGIFFPKTWYFFPGRKTREGWPFSRNTRKHDIFYLIGSTPPSIPRENKSKTTLSRKNILKDDWHPRLTL